MDLTESIKLDILEKIKEADKSWVVKLPDGIYCLPRSQCRIIDKHIFIPRWLADSKGIDYLDIDVEP